MNVLHFGNAFIHCLAVNSDKNMTTVACLFREICNSTHILHLMFFTQYKKQIVKMTRGYVPDFKLIVVVVVFRATLSLELKVGIFGFSHCRYNQLCMSYISYLNFQIRFIPHSS